MFLRHIQKITSLLILLATTGVYAQVPCPSLDVVHKAAETIQNAIIDGENTYLVYTPKCSLFESNFYWQIGILTVPAKSEDEAIMNGKKILQNANIIGHEYAYPLKPGMFYCNYGPGIIAETRNCSSQRLSA